jgi:HEAT repeat protein
MNHDALIIALVDADPEARLAAIAEVAGSPTLRLAEPVLDALIQCLGASRKVIQRRGAEALAAFAPQDTRVLRQLRVTLSHLDSRARWGAAYALGLVHLDGALDLRAMPVLVEALSSNDGDVRWAAAELVVRLGKENREPVSSQVIALAQEGNLNARKMALYGLRDLGGPREALLAVAESCCREHQSLLKMAALSLIARIQNPGDPGNRAAALAIGLLENDPDGGVRRCAAVALGHLGNRSRLVTEALARAANKEGDVYMKRAAEGALARLADAHQANDG